MKKQDPAIVHAQQVKDRYQADLLRYPNVLGVGIGLRQRKGEFTNEVSIVVTVRRKRRRRDLKPEDVLPTELEGVPVDVLEVGSLEAGRLETGPDQVAGSV